MEEWKAGHCKWFTVTMASSNHSFTRNIFILSLFLKNDFFPFLDGKARAELIIFLFISLADIMKRKSFHFRCPHPTEPSPSLLSVVSMVACRSDLLRARCRGHVRASRVLATSQLSNPREPRSRLRAEAVITRGCLGCHLASRISLTKRVALQHLLTSL